uniref:Transmembrane protein 53-like n=1 Tax=Nelumbo nucifera TaxID=4432 RepID=A0A822YF53_NELNU|nr:TPA_asm: hypothetical protein HUJ06_011655 [Nelumbo nucifera]
MGSLSGILQRPLTAVAAAAIASVSADISDKFPPPRSSDCSFFTELSNATTGNSASKAKSWVSTISVSKLTNLSFATRVQIPIPNINYAVPNSGLPSTQNLLSNSRSSLVAFPPILLTLYHSAKLAKTPKPIELTCSTPLSSPEVMYRWHLPDLIIMVFANADVMCQVQDSGGSAWMVGSKAKASEEVGGKAEQDIELLVNHLVGWLEEEHGKNLIFHTFSNTGWLTYGVFLNNIHEEQDPSLKGKIRGCIVDSAPVAASNPQVWASGFSAAFLKKQSIATKGSISLKESGKILIGTRSSIEAKPALTEAALLAILEKFFEVVLNLPTFNRRLSDVVGLLSSEQPHCPQLYIYSSADRVIPVDYVESFIDEQRRAGHEVRACNFISTPHVDHFRNDPDLYNSQLTNFLKDCVLTCCEDST